MIFGRGTGGAAEGLLGEAAAFGSIAPEAVVPLPGKTGRPRASSAPAGFCGPAVSPVTASAVDRPAAIAASVPALAEPAGPEPAASGLAEPEPAAPDAAAPDPTAPDGAAPEAKVFDPVAPDPAASTRAESGAEFPGPGEPEPDPAAPGSAAAPAGPDVAAVDAAAPTVPAETPAVGPAAAPAETAAVPGLAAAAVLGPASLPGAARAGPVEEPEFAAAVRLLAGPALATPAAPAEPAEAAPADPPGDRGPGGTGTSSANRTNPSPRKTSSESSGASGASAAINARAWSTDRGCRAVARETVAASMVVGVGCRTRTGPARSPGGWSTVSTYGPTATIVPTGPPPSSAMRRSHSWDRSSASVAGLTSSPWTRGQPSAFHGPPSGASRRRAGSGRSTPITTSTPAGSTTTASTGRSPAGRAPTSATPPITVLPRPREASAARTSSATREGCCPRRTSRTEISCRIRSVSGAPR